MLTVVSLLLRVAQGKLRCGIAEARLTALLKGDEVADGLRPVASGEVLRRVAGQALIWVKQEEIEWKLLAVNQFAFSPDGCLVAYNLAKNHIVCIIKGFRPVIRQFPLGIAADAAAQCMSLEMLCEITNV